MHAHRHHTPRRRFSAGGLATADECAAVMSAATDFAIAGRQCIQTHVMFDNDSPYTPRETVVSVRAVHAARLANEDPSRYQGGLNTLLEVAARMRRRIVAQFGLGETFYHLTEIVCREPRAWESTEECVELGCLPKCMRGCPEGCADASEGVTSEDCEKWCRDDCATTCNKRCNASSWLSHPLHSDANPGDCDLLENGMCVRRLPEDVTAHLCVESFTISTYTES